MKLTTWLREGARLAALVAAIAIVVSTMPEHPQAAAAAAVERLAVQR